MHLYSIPLWDKHHSKIHPQIHSKLDTCRPVRVDQDPSHFKDQSVWRLIVRLPQRVWQQLQTRRFLDHLHRTHHNETCVHDVKLWTCSRKNGEQYLEWKGYQISVIKMLGTVERKEIDKISSNSADVKHNTTRRSNLLTNKSNFIGTNNKLAHKNNHKSLTWLPIFGTVKVLSQVFCDVTKLVNIAVITIYTTVA